MRNTDKPLDFGGTLFSNKRILTCGWRMLRMIGRYQQILIQKLHRTNTHQNRLVACWMPPLCHYVTYYVWNLFRWPPRHSPAWWYSHRPTWPKKTSRKLLGHLSLLGCHNFYPNHRPAKQPQPIRPPSNFPGRMLAMNITGSKSPLKWSFLKRCGGVPQLRK